MTILTRYQALIQQGDLIDDTSQLKALTALDSLATVLNTVLNSALNNDQQKWLLFYHRLHGFFKQILRTVTRSLNTVQPKGIYLFGNVGRGKTMMMDLFYQQLSTHQKQRMHFHHFLELVHQQLTMLQGQSDPLNIIAKQFAAKYKVLCFDEFFVSDIGDAMLLSGLFTELFEQGITLVATSNCEPDQLYRNGLQRQRFLPTIKLIKQHCAIINVNGATDHRQHSKNYQRYVYPLSQGHDFLERSFNRLSKQALVAGEIEVNHRLIAYIAIDNDLNVVMFDFNVLCKGARSQRDYMSIAQQFDTVLLTNVPQFSGKQVSQVAAGIEDGFKREQDIFANMQSMDDEARRFIALVDEFYDQGIQLIIAAEVDIKELYQGKKLNFEFARCESRLMEMQVIDY